MLGYPSELIIQATGKAKIERLMVVFKLCEDFTPGNAEKQV